MNYFKGNRPHSLFSKLKRWLSQFTTSKPIRFLARQMSNLLMSWILYAYFDIGDLEKLEMIGTIVDTLIA